MNKRILTIQEALDELERFFADKVPDPKAAATRAMDWVLCTPEEAFKEPTLNAALKPWGRPVLFGNAGCGRVLGLGTRDWDTSVTIVRTSATTVELTLPGPVSV